MSQCKSIHSASSQSRLTSFVILFEARSGSTYLTECLNGHPDICAEKECLVKFREKKKSADEQLEWVRGFLGSSGLDSCRVVGFKTKIRDMLDSDGFAEILRELRTRVILLGRRNRIKLTASLFNAIRLNEKTGDWNLYQESGRLPAFAINVEDFRSCLEGNESGRQSLVDYVNQLNLPTLPLYYEDLFLDRRETLTQVCSFLGVEFVSSLEGNCLKNTSDDLREVLSNLDELRSHYAGTQYEEMFDEVLLD